MQVDITQDDIRKGRWGNALHCPIAHAVNRQLDYRGEARYSPEGHWLGHDGVIVSYNSPEGKPAVIYDDPRIGYTVLGYLPFEAVQWIKSFDKSGVAKPFSFELQTQEG